MVSIVGALEMAGSTSEVPVGLSEAEMEQLRGLVDFTEGVAEGQVEAVMREFMEEAGGVERNEVFKEEDAFYGRRREEVERRGAEVQSKRCKAIIKSSQNREKAGKGLTDEMKQVINEKLWLKLERLDMRKLGDRVRKRQVKREEKMRVIRLQMEVMRRVRESDKARRMQGDLFQASVGAVVAFDGLVEEVEEGLGAGGEEVMRGVRGKVEGLRETVKEAAVYMELVVKEEKRPGQVEGQGQEQEQDEQHEREVEVRPCCTFCGKAFSTRSNARRHELKQHREFYH